ncbi:hypothetical protein NDU88_005464 [Pleurodeles waltl]|uniref:Uncharacterized protein n=1 Tax=Pleurodeles waltl TaxID=8319 RepID=A0AAV7UI44_PLEWA|nr:hypothetical protein NDU88_005464 [Pleurodeles waltl]
MPPSGILLHRRYRDSVTEPHRVATSSLTLPEAARARTCPQSLGANVCFGSSEATVPGLRNTALSTPAR